MVSIMPELHRLTYGNTKPYPFDQWDRHHERVAKWFLESGIHEDIVRKFSITTGVMRNPVTIFKAVENFVLLKGRQGIGYCVFTIAPQYLVLGDMFCRKGLLTEKNVMDIIINGIKEGQRRVKEETGKTVTFKSWFGIGREVSAEEAIRLTRMMLECDPDYVPGISLVCHEPSGPPEKFVKAFHLAKNEGRQTACHVEWVKDRDESEKDTPEKIKRNFQEDLPQLTKNLYVAINVLNVDQVDHGMGLAENPVLMQTMADEGKRLAVCPGSLKVTKLIDKFSMLKIPEVVDAGVLTCLDVDDDICMPTLDEIFQELRDEYCRPASAENVDRWKDCEEMLIKNAELIRF